MKLTSRNVEAPARLRAKTCSEIVRRALGTTLDKGPGTNGLQLRVSCCVLGLAGQGEAALTRTGMSDHGARNPLQFDNIEGRGNSVSDTLKYTTNYLKHP